MLLSVAERPGGLCQLLGQNDFLLWNFGTIHYIGGTDVLPPPLDTEEETEAIRKLQEEQDENAKALLIEHNLRLVVYIAKKFDNTGVLAEDLISSFGLEEEYEDSDIEEDLYWAIHKIKEGIGKGAHDLDVLCSRMEYSSFVEEYCEEEGY